MSKVDQLIAWGEKEIGKPYVYGDEGPSDFDCSGLMQFIFAKVGIKLPRTADAQYHYAKAVASPRPGDLIFYVDGSGKATHVTLYLGSGKMLEAPHTGADVRIHDAYQLAGHTRHYGRIPGLGTLTAPVVGAVTTVAATAGSTVSGWLGDAQGIALEAVFGLLGLGLIGFGVYRLTQQQKG